MTETELSAAIAGSDLPDVMEKLGFSLRFVAENVMSASGPVTVAQVAMLWMGMPNKHDRKRARQMLDALASSGLLECVDEANETFRVRGSSPGSR